MKHHELIWGTALLAFIAWVFIASSDEVRIERACTPIHWAGSGIVSLTALTAPKYELDAQNMGNRVVYGCEYSLWRLFFQEKYNAWLAARRKVGEGDHQARVSCARATPHGPAGSKSETAASQRRRCRAPQVLVSQSDQKAVP